MSDPVPVGEAKRGFIRVEGLRLRVWPILFTILLGFGILALAQVTVEIVEHFTGLRERPQMPWIAHYYDHAIELVYTLIAIAIFKIFLRRDYGLHGPAGKSYLRAAVLWGLFFGVLMTMVDYWPELLAHTPPSDQPYPLTPLNIAGWFSFEGIFVGPSEETLFRGLLVTYLAAALPGRISIGRYEMNAAGVIVALIFALAHFGNFFTHPWWMALGQQFYAFALGVLYAYWFEKSRSLWAPIVGHNVGDVVEFALVFAMVAMWH
jgi:membrane protease YdiL (CAAX protease family)